MANTLYKNLFSQVNKLFDSDYLLRENIPEDISNWIYNIIDIHLEGKVLYINTLPDFDVYIIKDNNIDTDKVIKEVVLLNNKKCKVIVLSRNFLEQEISNVQVVIYDIYNFILNNIFTNCEGSGINVINVMAPYILTMNTMSSFGLTYSYALFDIEKEYYDVLVTASEYSVKELLDDGLLLRIVLK